MNIGKGIALGFGVVIVFNGIFVDERRCAARS